MAHDREIAEEQKFLDLALDALDHMRSEARSLRDSAAVANMRGAGVTRLRAARPVSPS